MNKTLSINAGSSSLKFQLYEMPEEKVMAKGLIERIGFTNSEVTIKHLQSGKEKNFSKITEIESHEGAVELLIKLFSQLGIITDFNDIRGIGHRVAQGGELFPDSVEITEEVIEQIESLSALAPLHNPPQAQVIRTFHEMLPDTLMAAVFDTSFHSTLPPESYLYSIPYEYYDTYRVRKYGFHGTSHRYVAQQAAKMMKQPIEDLKIITCHLGNGASVTAVEGGRSVDTSMGFTPLAGLTMGTRSGDVDASIIPFLMDKLAIEDVNDMVSILNSKSGILGVSGISSDMRDVEAAAEAGDQRAGLALNIFIRRVQQYIGSYISTMNGVDAIVFTAGIGENAPNIRQSIIDGISWFGAELDEVKNDTRKEAVISTDDALVTVLNIPTNEEIEIAREVERLAGKVSSIS